MNSSRRIILTLILLLLIPGLPGLSASANFRSWEFNTPEGIKGWRGEGVDGSRVQGGIFQVMGMEQFRLISPSNLKIPIRDNPYLRIRFRSQSPRYLRIFWQPRLGKPVLLPESIQPLFDRNFHTSWIPLTNKLEYRDTIEQLGLIFGGRPGWVEIDSIEIRHFSLFAYFSDQWSELWLPRNLHPGTINSLNSPRLFNKPFINWLNKLALLIFLIGAVLYYKASKTNRIKIISRIGLAILALWIIYDLRETYSQFKIVEEIYQSHIKPPAGQKSFPALGNFYDFIDFCEKHLPRDTQYHFYREWPYDTRIKYFLYPRRINCDASSQIISGQPIPYHVVYQNSLVKYDPICRQLRYGSSGGGFLISNPGKIIAKFDRNSFIFLEE